MLRSIHTTVSILLEQFKLYTVIKVNQQNKGFILCHFNESDALIKLHKIAEKITNSTDKMIKTDINKSEPGHPWRILNLNHGIIATRTHNIDIMNTVFEQLLQRLPDDAANFFADGMKQMVIIGYPEHVKHVMEQFYQLTNNPTLH
jgi:hypothetical protein